MPELHVIVSGRVQGVGFRDATQDMGQQLGLAGWVRNRSDGTVQVYARGEAPMLGELRAWLASGPPLARVDGVLDLPVSGNERSISPSQSFARLPTL
ncbi:hypothetical protein IP84_05425 [beta proteobacterium AAP99]|nr:hypothetical protein IP84_05425 [beta proteobacterium AAP99]